ADDHGEMVFLSKENDSNGCIGTVDVSYPSIPLFLLYNVELVKGMMRPIMKFAKMPVWNYDFAPHDVGTYPHCCGQVYGFKSEKDKYTGNLLKKSDKETYFPFYLLPENSDVYALKYQMPVEECANLLIMQYACFRCDKDISFFNENFDLSERWVEYLVKYGLKPEEQLCTDDFAGHLKNNLNLAIKATVGIACYSELAKAAQKMEIAEKYRKTAEAFATEITAFANRFSHLPISWDSDESTFSLKYNFAFDKLLGLKLFGQDIFEREINCYLQRANAYGVPLDNRKAYTKSDWLCWVATLTNDEKKREKLLSGIAKFLKDSPDRVPFSDWYDTDSGSHYYFRARSVQGGCFILLLGNPDR
ncbi:MAG: glutaminase domain-containing protein, partial [Candidatus Coproplasma sp.]